MDFVTRLAIRSDAAVTAELCTAAWRAAYVGLLPGDLLAGLDIAKAENAHAQRFEAQVSTPRMAAKQWVVEAGGKVVGLAGIGPGRDEEFLPRSELYSLNVHPDFWGTGAGHALHSRVLSELSQRSEAESYLWVLPGNSRARSFYERAGWVPTEYTKADPTAGESVVDLQYRLVHDAAPAPHNRATT